MGYLDAIQNSPSDIYHHALPLCPPSSWLHEYYSSELPQVKIVKGFQTTWGVCSRKVFFDDWPEILADWKDIVAVGFWNGQIIILDAVTGIQMSVLPGHTKSVRALTFSLDGASLVSGSDDETIKLWDIQTGGVIRTFQIKYSPRSVSISVDNATIACVYWDGKIGLWDTDLEKIWVMTGYNQANSAIFSLKNPQLLLIASNSMLQWNIDGPEPIPIQGDNIREPYDTPSFSSDRTCCISPHGSAATVHSTDSGVVIAKLKAPNSGVRFNWFISPNGNYAACAIDHTVFVWDITGPDPHLVNTPIGHDKDVTSILFSSSLISSSRDKSIKFWQIGAFQTEPVPTKRLITDRKLLSSTSSPPLAISLQSKDNAAILVDWAGVVRTWDLSTGLCKGSFTTPAISNSKTDIQLIGDRVIFVWCTTKKMHIWDAKRRKHH